MRVHGIAQDEPAEVNHISSFPDLDPSLDHRTRCHREKSLHRDSQSLRLCWERLQNRHALLVHPATKSCDVSGTMMVMTNGNLAENNCTVNNVSHPSSRRSSPATRCTTTCTSSGRTSSSTTLGDYIDGYEVREYVKVKSRTEYKPLVPGGGFGFGKNRSSGSNLSPPM